MTHPTPHRPRRLVVCVAALVAIGVVFLSPHLGRAQVYGDYRPLVPADGLTNGCYPLPGGVVPDFAYVLRHDGDTVDAQGVRRRVLLHYDLVDAAGATATIEAQFAAAGVTDVRVEAHDFDVPDDAVVRGEMLLDLPPIAVQSDSPVCDDVFSTKRFTPDLTDFS